MAGTRGGRQRQAGPDREGAREGGREDILNALVRLEQQAGRWVPTCNKEYEYTYNYTHPVDDCPISAEDEETYETAAERACRAKIQRYCDRTQNCKTLEILSSEPVGGGCNCITLPVGGTKCLYLVNWKIKYKCVQAA